MASAGKRRVEGGHTGWCKTNSATLQEWPAEILHGIFILKVIINVLGIFLYNIVYR